MLLGKAIYVVGSSVEFKVSGRETGHDVCFCLVRFPFMN